MSNIISGPDSLSVNYNDVDSNDVVYVNLYNVGGHVRQDKGTGTKINIGEYISGKDKTRHALSHFFIQGSKKDTLGHKSFLKGIAKAIYTYDEAGKLNETVLQAPNGDDREGLWMKYQFTQTKAVDFISLVEQAANLPIFNEEGEVEIADWSDELTPDEQTGVNLCRLDWQLVLKVSRKVGYSATKDTVGKSWNNVNTNAWNIHGIMLVGPEHPMYFYNHSAGEDLLEVLDILGWVKQESSKGSTTLDRINAIRNKSNMGALAGNAVVAVAPNAPMPTTPKMPVAELKALALTGKVPTAPQVVPVAEVVAPQVIKWVAPSGKKEILKSSFYSQLVEKVNELTSSKLNKEDVWTLGNNGTSANSITSLVKAAEAQGVAPSSQAIAELAQALAAKVAPAVEEVEEEVETFTVATEEVDLNDIEGYFPTPKAATPEVTEVATEVASADEIIISDTVTLDMGYDDEDEVVAPAPVVAPIAPAAPKAVAAKTVAPKTSAASIMGALDPAAIAAAMNMVQATISLADCNDDDLI